jgi:hypothetical protein
VSALFTTSKSAALLVRYQTVGTRASFDHFVGTQWNELLQQANSV